MPDIFQFLREQAIDYWQVEHPPVFTSDEAARLLPPMPGIPSKNLFLWYKKGRGHILVVVPHDKSVDLKALATVLDIKNLGLASAERLQKILQVEPGSVSLLALVNDTLGKVEVVLDEPIWAAGHLQCHPLFNTTTLVLSHTDMQRFLAATNHTFRVVNVPARTSDEFVGCDRALTGVVDEHLTNNSSPPVDAPSHQMRVNSSNDAKT
jgi:Ala-tRNA(Pro) deacylase